ncbi:MAG: hypothetical protein JNL79_36850 [Myxococcales bacterium]|nr:hypothetical protein [Myxococcales bacterium]
MAAEVLAQEIRATLERASVSGARLVGVAADGASFGFDDDALEDAIDLAVSFVSAGHAPLRVGIGRGDLAPVREPSSFEAFAVGSAAARATALARVGGDGEVLVDLEIPEARSGGLLSLGKRVASLHDLAGAHVGSRFRAIVLDHREPFRREGGASVERIQTPRVIGREASLAMVDAVMPGGLAVVRAMPGIGGTRFLEELQSRASRALFVEPVGCSVEPLGALRVALARNEHRRERTSTVDDALAALLSGQGVDVPAASDLLNAWLEVAGHDAHDERSWVLVDDASLVDRATLEAIGHAASVPDTRIAVVVRVDEGDVLPPALAQLVVEAEVTLRPLAPHEGAAVVEEACGPGVAPEVVRRWTRRGGGIPLAILESLRHGLALGDLAVRTGDGGRTVIVPRSKTSGRGRTLGPRGWIARRATALGVDRPEDRLLLSLSCLAGSNVERVRLEQAASEHLDVSPPAVDASIARLVREALLVEHAGTLSPSSRTLRDTVLESLDEGTRKALHAAYAAVVARTSHGLDLAEGAHHAALAGDHLGAAALAGRAAERCRRVGLTEWATSLLAFARAEGGDVAPFPTTPSPAPRPSMPSPAPEVAPPSITPEPPTVAQLDRDGPVSRTLPDLSPRSRTIPEPSRAEPSRAEPSRAEPSRAEASRPAPRSSAEARMTLGVTHLSTGQIAALPAPPPVLIPEIVMPVIVEELESDVLEEEPPSTLGDDEAASVRDGLRQLGDAARKALATADLQGLDAALSAIEVVGGSRNALTRLRGLSAVARGKVDEGLSLLRRARAQATTDAELARDALAHAVALDVAGLRDDAILEAMTALAIERKSGGPDQPARRVLARLVGAP